MVWTTEWEPFYSWLFQIIKFFWLQTLSWLFQLSLVELLMLWHSTLQLVLWYLFLMWSVLWQVSSSVSPPATPACLCWPRQWEDICWIWNQGGRRRRWLIYCRCRIGQCHHFVNIFISFPSGSWEQGSPDRPGSVHHREKYNHWNADYSSHLYHHTHTVQDYWVNFVWAISKRFQEAGIVLTKIDV